VGEEMRLVDMRYNFLFKGCLLLALCRPRLSKLTRNSTDLQERFERTLSCSFSASGSSSLVLTPFVVIHLSHPELKQPQLLIQSPSLLLACFLSALLSASFSIFKIFNTFSLRYRIDMILQNPLCFKGITLFAEDYWQGAIVMGVTTTLTYLITLACIAVWGRQVGVEWCAAEMREIERGMGEVKQRRRSAKYWVRITMNLYRDRT
jgi:hypothetical protein